MGTNLEIAKAYIRQNISEYEQNKDGLCWAAHLAVYILECWWYKQKVLIVPRNNAFTQI